MAKSIPRHRKTAFELQNGRCCYCGFQMWQESVEAFAKLHRISVSQAKQFQCTAEHLTARKDGGKDSRSNIAAACARCNLLRHQRKSAPGPLKYQELVQKRLDKGRWVSLSPQSRLDRSPPPDLARLFGIGQASK